MVQKINLPNPHTIVKKNKGGRPQGSRGQQYGTIAKFPPIVAGMMDGKSNEEIANELGYTGKNADQSLYAITKHHDFQSYLAYVVSTQTNKIFEEIERLANSDSAVDRRKAVDYRIKMVQMVWPRMNISLIEKREVEESRTQSREVMGKVLEILTDDQKQRFMRDLERMVEEDHR